MLKTAAIIREDVAQLPRAIRVMIVDDAVVVRGLLSRWLGEAGGIEIVSTHRNGREALAAVDRVNPDVILLDIEMPEMDGVTALPLLLRKQPSAAVIIASTLTSRNAEISIRCLELGAQDYITKPSTNRDVTFSASFRQDIISKVKALGSRAVRSTALGRRGQIAAKSVGAGSLLDPDDEKLLLRPLTRVTPRVLVIGASTGGPNAVAELLRLCRPALQGLPVLVAQHMPPMFTGMFAQHLRRQIEVDASEAQSGQLLASGKIYIAPGGRHLRVEAVGKEIRIVIDDSPPVNFCKPSIDMVMHSASQAYGAGVLAVVLTGMGTDGLRGASDIVAAGGNVLAQDEASSVVWGMPGAVARHGLCAAVGPLKQLAQIINTSAGVSP